MPGRSHGRPGEAIEVRLQLIWILGRTDRNQLLAVDTEVDPLSSLAEGGDRIEQSGGKRRASICPVYCPHLKARIDLDRRSLDATAHAVSRDEEIRQR